MLLIVVSNHPSGESYEYVVFFGGEEVGSGTTMDATSLEATWDYMLREAELED